MDTPFHELDPDRRLARPRTSPIDIGENVWLGARVMVMPGVTIGRDAAVGAGSIVTSDVPPRTLVAGVPARVIKEL
jgi:acetyltransferase-like isoleucine patch superfamily enzyme